MFPSRADFVKIFFRVPPESTKAITFAQNNFLVIKWAGIIGLVITVIAGCGPHVYYEKSIQLDNLWPYEDSHEFEFEVKDTLPPYDLFLELTHDVEFQFQNIYTKVKTVFPDKKEVEHVISLNLTDANNQWMGDCSSSTCTARLTLSENIYFKSPGFYKIVLEQFGRIDSLHGVRTLHFSLSEHLKE